MEDKRDKGRADFINIAASINGKSKNAVLISPANEIVKRAASAARPVQSKVVTVKPAQQKAARMGIRLV